MKENICTDWIYQYPCIDEYGNEIIGTFEY